MEAALPKITRKAQKIFGSNAGINQTGVIGSFAAGSPAYSTDPDTIQSLSNYLTGWYGVVAALNSPAIQDMNALDFLITRQLAYLFQNGIAEWNSATTYYIGSWATDSSGNAYISTVDDNTNNALTDTTKWRPLLGSTTTLTIANSPYAITSANNRATFLVTTAGGAFTFNLPAAALNAGLRFTVKDISGQASTNNITIARNGSESIEGGASNYLCQSDWGSWTFICDGTNWYIL